MTDQLTGAQLLVKYGFFKEGCDKYYSFNEEKGYYVPVGAKPEEAYYNEAHADQEIDEEVNLGALPPAMQPYQATGFPKPGKRFRLELESFNMSLEEMYFWTLNHMRRDQGFPHTVKVTDIFSASENSAFFGQSAQRLSIQEDRASSFLRGISELIKTLFQIVRELRIIDERLEIYHSWKKSKSADATLKGIFADFAENKGGQMQPGSIFHLSNQVGYAVLPDLFFNTVVYDKEKIDQIVDGMSFNKNVKNVLKRKLFQFLVWKEKTQAELEARRKFQIKYLRQHYTVIKTYIAWVKPYLKHIRRLQMNEKMLDSADLVSSFETSSTEIEVIVKKPLPRNACNAVVLLTFKFTTRPVMQYRQENFQGPVHIGSGECTWRSYAWTDEEINMYKKMRDSEDLALLGMVDEQLKAAMDMLGSDLEKYIKEAEATTIVKHDEYAKPPKQDKKKNESNQDSVFDPFIALFKGFWEIGGLMVPKGISGGGKKSSEKKKNREAALGVAGSSMWLCYKNYKKAHKMLSW